MESVCECLLCWKIIIPPMYTPGSICTSDLSGCRVYLIIPKKYSPLFKSFLSLFLLKIPYILILVIFVLLKHNHQQSLGANNL